MASYSGQCPLCNGLRGHGRLKDAMFDEFDAEFKRASLEVMHLQQLYTETCWYNFETRCRTWQEPWHESYEGSPCTLRKYYTGSVRDAPCLPPVIVKKELEAAKEYADYMAEQRYAPYDWAPGGRAYERMVRESAGVAAYNALQSSNAITVSK